ncbi:zinc finger BED domain-containing protein RICESLEEPER 2-like [Cicer arietinum]|uniref:Zinc finger BED domain-containing protein RICESLEEPER 2-like n=1 Tax=Cicer arietinum TaxID=3827 RepID=A0A1S3EIE2_CICAR|nr:zinc finger BED domain-containing protein RICESLEEPER 2-like [Cicer arietinum]
MSCNNLVFNGEYMHMRCCAPILNIIVSEGLSDLDMSILRLRATVKYARSSPLRFAKFKACVERSNSEYKGLVCLDVETRWNSTYLMLDSALKHQKAFEVLEIHDPKYLFYDATLRISGSSYVASNMYMLEVFGIGEKILKMCNSKDMCLKVMADRMKTKYDKYWGKYENLNMLLLISSVLDPRNKLKFVNWLITQNFNSFDATKLKDLLKTRLDELILEYSGVGEGFQSESQSTEFDLSGKEDLYSYNRFLMSTGSSSTEKSDLERYLEESLESRSSTNFDVLNWWRLNSSRFPILAKIAKDLLAIPISTVAFESSFTTGGRVIDEYRSCLTPQTVEALVCTASWLKGLRKPSSISDSLLVEDFKELEILEEWTLTFREGLLGRIAYIKLHVRYELNLNYIKFEVIREIYENENFNLDAEDAKFGFFNFNLKPRLLMKIVLQVDVHDDKTKKKAIKAISNIYFSVHGFEGAEINLNWRHSIVGFMLEDLISLYKDKERT